MGQVAMPVPFFVMLRLTFGQVLTSLRSLRRIRIDRGLRTKYKE